MTKARENGDGGLILIGTVNANAASSVVFTNLVSSKKYRLSLGLYGSVEGSYLRFRFREGSTDKGSSYYGGSFSSGYAGATGNYLNSNNNTHFEFGRLSSGVNTLCSVDSDIFISPSKVGGYVNGKAYIYYNSLAVSFGFHNDAMTSCDGISLFVSSGTFTGQIKLYEYR